jgi:hypothetical protein
MYTWHYQHH